MQQSQRRQGYHGPRDYRGCHEQGMLRCEFAPLAILVRPPRPRGYEHLWPTKDEHRPPEQKRGGRDSDEDHPSKIQMSRLIYLGNE